MYLLYLIRQYHFMGKNKYNLAKNRQKPMPIYPVVLNRYVVYYHNLT